MGRFEQDAKLGYYATPECMTQKTARRLRFEGPTRLFDPCCGEGIALRHIQDLAPKGSRSYGIEVDKARAQKAQMILDVVVASAYELCRVEKASMPFLWLNPPYDNRGGQGGSETRTELAFLRETAKFVAPHGVLVYIIPRTSLSKEMVSALELRYTNLAVYKFDEDEYAAYKQVVVFGTRREKLLESTKLLTPSELQARNELLLVGSSETATVFYLDEMDGRSWAIPQCNVEIEVECRGNIEDEQELLKDLARSDGRSVLESMLQAPFMDVSLNRPLLPFKRTHLATLIAAGVLNGAVGIGPDRHMVVGATRKVMNRTTTVDDDGNEIVIDTEEYKTLIRTIETDGTIRDLQ